MHKSQHKKPIKIELDTGEYWWCSCGRSPQPPFCKIEDKQNYCKPKLIKINTKSVKVLCNCSLSKDAPYCDGSHKIFNE